MKRTRRPGHGRPQREELLRHAIAYVNGRKSTGLLKHARDIHGLLLPRGPEAKRFQEVLALLREYALRPTVERPLCLAVFGPPGSGKTYGVTRLLTALTKYAKPKTINLSQLQSSAELAHKFEVMRSAAGGIPTLFFDEFDTSLDGHPLAWLQYFLAPMQDGALLEDGEVVKRAVFLFAGGTAETFADFEKYAKQDEEAYRARKVPDFISRLRGVVDIAGVNVPGNERIVRRAIILKSLLAKRSKDRILVQDSLLRSLLTTAHFVHGTRSLEALLDMSQLEGRQRLMKAQLPSDGLKRLHLSHGPLDRRTIGLSAGIDEASKPLFKNLSRVLLEKGATIAYGGDLVPHGTLEAIAKGAQELPDPLIERREVPIHNYLAYPSHLNPKSPKLRAPFKHVKFHDLGSLTSAELKHLGVRDRGYFESIPTRKHRPYDPAKHLAWSISLFRMRLRLVEEIDVLVVVGGSNTGRSWGRFSGIAEEVMLAVALGKPLYVLGGAGGAAREVGRLLGLADAPVGVDDCLREGRHPELRELLSKHEECFYFPSDAELPQTLEGVRRFLHCHGITGGAWRWNGLDVDENRQLFGLRLSPSGALACVDLIAKGLSRLHWHAPSKAPA